MQTPSSATLSIVLSVSLGAVFAATPDLPEAVFDRGGNMFDLEKISAARFPIPEGGFSGKASRLKDSDPLQPVVLSVDWAKVRKTAKGGAKGFRLRYRYHTLDADTRRAMDEAELAEERTFSPQAFVALRRNRITRQSAIIYLERIHVVELGLLYI